MTENTAMNLLGLKLSTEGKNRKPKQVTDYSEDELLNAFRETCNMIGKQFLLEGFLTHISATGNISAISHCDIHDMA